jgi:hypothetical protein
VSRYGVPVLDPTGFLWPLFIAAALITTIVMSVLQLRRMRGRDDDRRDE